MNRRSATPMGRAVRLLAAVTPFILACGESDAMMVGVSDVPDALSITVDYLAPGRPLDSPEQLVLEVGDSASLSATALNALGLALGDLAISWSSSDVLVADVTADGLVTALAPGVADISASVDDVSATLQTVVSGTGTAPIPNS